jgi:hypothetical protein
MQYNYFGAFEMRIIQKNKIGKDMSNNFGCISYQTIFGFGLCF